MSMDEEHIQAVMKILSEWDPLGDEKEKVEDLRGYWAEAIDILMALRIQRNRKPEFVVRDVLNQAFRLSLEAKDCTEPARRIVGIVENGK